MNEKSNKTLKIQKGVMFSDHDHFKKESLTPSKQNIKKLKGDSKHLDSPAYLFCFV